MKIGWVWLSLSGDEFTSYPVVMGSFRNRVIWIYVHDENWDSPISFCFVVLLMYIILRGFAWYICPFLLHLFYQHWVIVRLSQSKYSMILKYMGNLIATWTQQRQQDANKILGIYFLVQEHSHSKTGVKWTPYMVTSSNGNIFRVTGPLCGEFTGPGEFPAQRPVTRSFDVVFDLRLNTQLSKQPWGWWFETPSWSLWRHFNDLIASGITLYKHIYQGIIRGLVWYMLYGPCMIVPRKWTKICWLATAN